MVWQGKVALGERRGALVNLVATACGAGKNSTRGGVPKSKVAGLEMAYVFWAQALGTHHLKRSIIMGAEEHF